MRASSRYSAAPMLPLRRRCRQKRVNTNAGNGAQKQHDAILYLINDPQHIQKEQSYADSSFYIRNRLTPAHQRRPASLVPLKRKRGKFTVRAPRLPLMASKRTSIPTATEHPRPWIKGSRTVTLAGFSSRKSLS
jgi:hypothetical protein